MSYEQGWLVIGALAAIGGVAYMVITRGPQGTPKAPAPPVDSKPTSTP